MLCMTRADVFRKLPGYKKLYESQLRDVTEKCSKYGDLVFQILRTNVGIAIKETEHDLFKIVSLSNFHPDTDLEPRCKTISSEDRPIEEALRVATLIVKSYNAKHFAKSNVETEIIRRAKLACEESLAKKGYSVSNYKTKSIDSRGGSLSFYVTKPNSKYDKTTHKLIIKPARNQSAFVYSIEKDGKILFTKRFEKYVYGIAEKYQRGFDFVKEILAELI